MILRSTTLLWLSTTLILFSCFTITDASIAAMSIDLGSSFLKIGLVKPGIPMEIILNKDSQRKTANLIAFHNGERLFGEHALQIGRKHPEKVIPYVTDLVGKQFSNPIVQEYIKQFPYLNVTEDPVRGTVMINTKDSGSFNVETLLAMILWNAHEQAVVYGKTPVHDVIITVPAYLNQAEREAIVRASEIAGFNLLQLMSDSSAAALNYAFTRRKDITEKAQHVLIYDIGASKTVASVVELKLAKSNVSKTLEPVVTMKGVGFNRQLGGRSLTFKVRDFLAEEFSKQHQTSKKIADDLRAMSKLLQQAERVKHVLSANTETMAQVESVFEDKDFRLKVHRDHIVNFVKDYEEGYMKPVLDALKMAELNVDDIDQIILFGAGTRIPRIQEVLKELFKGKEPNRFLNTDEAAALGALYQAAHLSKGFKVKKIDVQELVIYPIQIRFDTVSGENESEMRHVERTLFTYRSHYPTNRKIMTFTSHSTDFAVNLRYGAAIGYLSKEQLEEFGSSNISEVAFRGISEAIEKNIDDDHIFKGVKAFFLIDYYGIVRNDGAEVIIKKIKTNATLDSIVESIGKFFGASTDKEETKEGLKDEPPLPTVSTTKAPEVMEPEATTQSPDAVKLPTENKTADGINGNYEQEMKGAAVNKGTEKAANQSESGDTVKNETLHCLNETTSKPKKEPKSKVIKPKLKIKYYNAYIGLNKENIKESKKVLSGFERIERLKAERDAAHNGIESRVYEIKERMHDENFMAFAQGNEVKNLTQLLEVTATWIEDEAGLSTTTEEFRAKQAPIDEIIFAIEKRIQNLIDAEMKKKAEKEAKERAEMIAKLKAEAEAKMKEIEEAARAKEANDTVPAVAQNAEKQEENESVADGSSRGIANEGGEDFDADIEQHGEAKEGGEAVEAKGEQQEGETSLSMDESSFVYSPILDADDIEINVHHFEL